MGEAWLPLAASPPLHAYQASLKELLGAPRRRRHWRATRSGAGSARAVAPYSRTGALLDTHCCVGGDSVSLGDALVEVQHGRPDVVAELRTAAERVGPGASVGVYAGGELGAWRVACW